MKHYRDMFVWENIRSHSLLVKYRNLVINYFNEVNYGDHYDYNLYDTPNTQQKRSEINMLSSRVYDTIISAGVRPVVHYSPPPSVGGMSGNIDLVINLFNLRRFDISPQNLIDFVDRAIGVYKADESKAGVRTINPFFWIYLILGSLIKIPFIILGGIGFNQNKIEGSILGKIFKGMAFLAALIFTIIQIFDKLGMISTLKRFVGIN